MAVMMHRPGRSWEDSACDVRGDVDAAAHGTIHWAMAVVIHKRVCSWGDSACNDHRADKTEPLVGRSHSRWLPRFINFAARETIQSWVGGFGPNLLLTPTNKVSCNINPSWEFFFQRVHQIDQDCHDGNMQ